MAKGKKTGGRKSGTPNKTTAALKDMILEALDGAGGIDYLERQAEETPTAFLALVGKVLPLTLAGDKENPLTIALGGLGASIDNKLDRLIAGRTAKPQSEPDA